MEHHANLVPWQQLVAATGATLEVVRLTDDGRLDAESLERALARRPKLVAVAHVSNALGTINPVERIAAEAHRAGAVVVLDAAQSVPHMPVDVAALGVDFAALSGHKMLGPSGIGALWGRAELLEAMPPFLTGGSMISRVTLEGASWAEIPHKFEAGTPAIAEAIGLGVAVEYLEDLGMARVREHERGLFEAAWSALGEVPGLRRLGPGDPDEQAAVISFTVDGIHPHDLAQVLDGHGVAIRAGHHCAQPVMQRYGLAATARASFSVYNDVDDVERLTDAIRAAQRVFGVA
jgi:cysteine desulfurase/selenocysteine lyase